MKVYSLPATALSTEKGFDGIANMILLGAVIEKSGVIDKSSIPAAMSKVVSAKHKDLYDYNIKAIELGCESI